MWWGSVARAMSPRTRVVPSLVKAMNKYKNRNNVPTVTLEPDMAARDPSLYYQRAPAMSSKGDSGPGRSGDRRRD